MNTYDRHLLREWLSILGLVLGAMLGLLLLQVLYDDFRTLRELGAGPAGMVRYFIVRVPSFLSIVLPVALLISLMFVLGKLHRANELTALRAAGVSLRRITAPIWAVGALACGLSWWLNTRVVPWSVEESQSMLDALQFRREADMRAADHVGAVYSVGFDNPHGRRMWFLNRYSQFTHRGYGVSVSLLDDQDHEQTRLLAAEAWAERGGGWVFRDGRELTFRPETGELVASVPFAKRVESGFTEDPELMLLIDRRPEDLALPELRRLMTYYQAENQTKGIPYAVRFFSLIASTLSPLIVIAIAIPFSVSGIRVNPAVGVSKSLGLFVLYYLLAAVASAFATKQWLDPDVAAWLPNGGLAVLAAWFFIRLR